jgi:hypothetical protein
MAQAGVRVELPDFPLSLEHVWLWFIDLNAERTQNGFGISPLKSAEIAAWAAARFFDLTSFDIELLLAIDRIYIGVANG